MSWTAEFVYYENATSGAATHSITEFEMDIDPQRFTGIDYHKQEIRFCNITMFSDTWLKTFISIFMDSTTSRIGDYPFWTFVVRLKYSGNIEYIGYLKDDGVGYDKKTDIYSLRLCDTLGIMNYIGSIEEVGKNNNHMTTIGFNIRNALIKMLDIIIDTPGLDVTVSDNYDLGLDINVTDITLYNKNNDTQLAEKLDEKGLEDFEWVSEITDTFTTAMISDNHWYLRKNYIYGAEYLGAVRYVWVRYSQKGLGYETYGVTTVAKVEEHLLIKELVIDNDILVASDNIIDKKIQSHAGAAAMITYLNTGNNLFETDYVAEGYLETDIYEYVSGDDIYNIEDDGNVLHYDGLLNMTTLRWGTDIYTANNIIRLLLAVSNIGIIIQKDGNIELINKNNTSGTPVVISDNDLISLNSSGILRSELDFSSLTFVVSDLLKAPLAEVLNQYYNNLFLTLFSENSILIENNYDLLINDVITVYDNNYKISSINLDNDKFVYTIKAWRI